MDGRREVTDVVRREDALLEKIHALVTERDDLLALVFRLEAELNLYRTLVTRASLDPAHV
jgi:hypothetical protein